MLKNKNKLLGMMAIATAAAAWGIDGVVLTPRLYNLDVSFVVFMLHLLPFLAMNLFFFREYSHLSRFSRTDFIFLCLIALLGGAVGTMSIVKALFLVNFQNLSVVVLLQKLQPVFAIVMAAVILKEKVTSEFFKWASLAIIGSYFLSFGGQLPNIGTDRNTLYAVGFSLLAAFSFGSATVFGKRIMMNYEFTTATFYRYALTTLIMLFYVTFLGTIGQWTEISPMNWGIFVLIGLTTGSGAIALYYFGLKKVTAMVSTICELFFPISAIFFDYLVNDSLLSPIQWGSALVMVYAIFRISSIAKGTESREENEGFSAVIVETES
ncbi:MAG: EamA family transporter [SAR324 cluster bacterium]|nr:EamA family transporter [SAR324 cluster bacterium]